MSFVDLLRERRLIGIVRGPDAEAALATVLTLVDEGIDLVEVSLNTTDAFDVIAHARARLGANAAVGAGTVLTEDDAARAAAAGATFVVTPGLGPGVDAAIRRGLPVIAGALTPTEVVTVLAKGIAAVKLFPAALGGESYLRALLDPFPNVAFVPVGQVDAKAAVAYLAAGATAVGVGSPLVGDAARGGSLVALRQRARSFREAL